MFLLRADNQGEGGILTLMALVQRGVKGGLVAVPFLGVVGAALFYGDAVITPAISVLSAVEGLKIITPGVEPYIVPISGVILIALFAFQRYGTGKVAAFFGPIRRCGSSRSRSAAPCMSSTIRASWRQSIRHTA